MKINSLLFLIFCQLGLFPVNAQIIPSSDTKITWDESTKTITIDEDITAGTNRFYSFTEFNLQQGQTARFQVTPDILNTLVRVFGDNPSFIDGKLQANSNLWLINSNGLVFGPNASLDVSGLFVASTAIWVGFPGSKYWLTARPNTVNPIGEPTTLGFGFFPNPILNFADLTSDRGIALIGGGVINLGTITSPITTLIGTGSLPRKYTIIQGGQLVPVTNTFLGTAPINVTSNLPLGVNYCAEWVYTKDEPICLLRIRRVGQP